MPGRVVVFLGPSLSVAKAKEILDADYRPPAKRGDIFRAAEDGADVICLIDGVFFQECSVAHKEVIYALDKGAVVIGASSMGALRASELDVYGMQGVGRIYIAYKNGELVSDDEVALVFDPETLEPLSEPLVNIRFNLDTACNQKWFKSSTRDMLFGIARDMYFPERTYESVIDAARSKVDESEIERVIEFLAAKKRDFKKEDAILALKLARDVANGPKG